MAVGTRRDPYAALRSGDFRLYIFSLSLTVLGQQLVGVAIGWELYDRTGDAFALGLVGLVQVVPVVLLTQLALAGGSLALAALSFTRGPIPLFYACLFGIGLIRALNNPARATLLPQTVPPELFTSAATWRSSATQLASVIGPGLGGLLIAATGGAG